MDDWAITTCDECGEYRKCYLEEDGTYTCTGEDCAHLIWLNDQQETQHEII